MITITVTGHAAALIEKANNASFYGIMKSFGSLADTAPGRAAAEDAVSKWLDDHEIDYHGFNILKARTIDTSGEKTPYRAEIDFIYD